MKKCLYCGHIADENAVRCPQCKAGFPVEEKILSGDTNENSETGDSTKRNGDDSPRANKRKRSE